MIDKDIHSESLKPRQKRLRQVIGILETGILKIFEIKEDRGIDEQSSSKTAHILNTMEKGMFSAVNALEERNSDSFRSELTQKLSEINFETLDIHVSVIEQIQDSLQFITDEKTGKIQRQIFLDLKREDARIGAYLDIFSKFGVVFDDEKLVGDKMHQLISWDSSLENFLQNEIIQLIKEAKRQKSVVINTIIEALQTKK